MILNLLKKYWLHIILWITMLLYFMYAPDLFTLFLARNGTPLQTNRPIPSDSTRISYGITALEPYPKDSENLYELSGWALMFPKADQPTESFERELVLISGKRNYAFSIPSQNFNILIAQDVLKPGKYRIGFVFRDPSTGEEFFWDKPTYYIIKTVNTMRLEGKSNQ